MSDTYEDQWGIRHMGIEPVGHMILWTNGMVVAHDKKGKPLRDWCGHAHEIFRKMTSMSIAYNASVFEFTDFEYGVFNGPINKADPHGFPSLLLYHLLPNRP